MQKYFEKIKERLEEEVAYQSSKADEAGKTCAFEEITVVKAREKMAECYEHAIEIVNQVAEEYKDKYVSIGAYQQVAWERDIAIKQLHDLGYEFGQKFDSNDVIVSNLAKAYAVNIKRYGVDVTEKWATATQNAAALNQAYLRGRQDERDKFDEWREEYNKEHNTEHNKEYNTDAPDIYVWSKDGWIPVSSGKLPDDNEIHECTAQFSTGMRYIEYAYYDLAREEWWSHDDTGLVNVIAWKPLPKPYKPKGE